MQAQAAPAPAVAPRRLTFPRASGLLLVGAIATGVLFDLAVRSGTSGLGAAVTVWTLVAAVLAGRQTRNPWSVGCFVGAAALAVWLVLRASPWLVLPDYAAIALLLAVGMLLGADGSPFDFRWSTLGGRALSLLPRLVRVPGWMVHPIVDLTGRATRTRRSDVVAVARGVVIAIPIAVVLGVLLGSADPVFASFFNTSGMGDPSDLLLHGVLVVTGALLLGVVAAGAAAAYPVRRAARDWLGSREALVVMVVIDVLFALFAFAQVDAAAGGAGAALRSAGVTYAEYARSGFFELLWVAGLTWVVVVVARGALPATPSVQRYALMASIEVAVGLVLLIVFVAHSRLQLYEAAFGFTVLRLYSHVFSALAAAAFVLLGVSVAGVQQSRSWLFGAVGALALAVLIGLNAANPETLVVQLDVQRAQRTHDLDPYYLTALAAASDDPVPLLLSAASGLDPQDRATILQDVCFTPTAASGWESFNVATRAAHDARSRYCPR